MISAGNSYLKIMLVAKNRVQIFIRFVLEAMSRASAFCGRPSAGDLDSGGEGNRTYSTAVFDDSTVESDLERPSRLLQIVFVPSSVSTHST